MSTQLNKICRDNNQSQKLSDKNLKVQSSDSSFSAQNNLNDYFQNNSASKEYPIAPWRNHEYPITCEYNSPGCHFQKLCESDKSSISGLSKNPLNVGPLDGIYASFAYRSLTDSHMAEIIKLLKPCIKIHILDLSANKFSTVGIQILATQFTNKSFLPELKKLILNKCQLSDHSKTVLNIIKNFRKSLELDME